MAHPGGLDADQEFTAPGRGQVEIVRPRAVAIRRMALATDLFEYGATDPHDYSLPSLADRCNDRAGSHTLLGMREKSEIRFLPVGGRRVAYEVRGSGPPLVAPAWWVSHLELDWQNADFRRFWEGLADGYTLIRYDRLGVGMSDRTLHDADLTLDSEVATLRALSTSWDSSACR